MRKEEQLQYGKPDGEVIRKKETLLTLNITKAISAALHHNVHTTTITTITTTVACYDLTGTSAQVQYVKALERFVCCQALVCYNTEGGFFVL